MNQTGDAAIALGPSLLGLRFDYALAARLYRIRPTPGTCLVVSWRRINTGASLRNPFPTCKKLVQSQIPTTSTRAWLKRSSNWNKRSAQAQLEHKKI